MAARDEDQAAAVIAADAEDSNGAPCFKLRVLSVPSLPWQIIVLYQKIENEDVSHLAQLLILLLLLLQLRFELQPRLRILLEELFY